MIRICAILLAATGCTQTSMPEPFGVTMVEETTCIGQGGAIVMTPDGAICVGGQGQE